MFAIPPSWPVPYLQRSWEVKAAKKADDLLESFMGIRDMELGELPSNLEGACVYTCP